MNDEINYKNNPLHGLSLKNMLIELVDHYGFEILHAYLNINCFKTKPDIASSVKFLKKTDWAREKVEVFYLYQFKNLPKASSEQFALPPRSRIIPDGQLPGEPAELSLEDAKQLREKREKKAAAYDRGTRNRNKPAKRNAAQHRQPSSAWANSKRDSLEVSDSSTEGSNDPWANSRKKHGH